MRKLASIITFVLVAASGFAQQMPQYTNFDMNYFGLNPAVAGSEECLDLKIGYRRQWIGLEGSPTSAFLNAHGKVGKSRTGNFHGVGGMVETDKTGPISFTSAHGAYAYHLRVNRKYMLAMGATLGLLQYRLDLGGAVLPEVGALNDPALLASQSSLVFPMADIGFWLYGKDHFIGLSMKNILNTQVQDIGLDTYVVPHFLLSGGVNIDLNKGFEFKPQALVKYVGGSRLAADLNLLFEYKDVVTAGLGVRSENGISGIVRFNVLKYFSVGYSYDYTLSKIRFGGQNTHELVIGIQACPDGQPRGIPCSAYD